MGDGGVPVGELALDRQQLPGFAAAVAEVAVRERERSDPCCREALGERIEPRLAGGSETVAEYHHRRVVGAGGEVEPGRAAAVTGTEGDVEADRFDRHGRVAPPAPPAPAAADTAPTQVRLPNSPHALTVDVVLVRRSRGTT